MSFEKHPLHLKDSELQKSEEVVSAVKKQERLEDEKIPNDPTPRIEVYMHRLENVFLNPDERVRERNIDLLRDKIYDELLVKRENFPESYFELQQRIARERGQPVEDIPQDTREQMITTAIEDQRASLDNWIDYLTSDDAMYPTWFKYYVWKNITKLSQFDKERGEFKTRTENTVAPFPDIYREPLAQIADLYSSIPQIQKEIEPKLQELRSKRNALRQQARAIEDEDKKGELLLEIGVIDEEIKTLNSPIDSFNKKFPSLYAHLIQKTLEQQLEGKEEVRGEWVKYHKGNSADAERLYQSLENKGTGWCTAGHKTAEVQIKNGDFYVYYTYNKDGEPTQPRIAIRMQGDHIAEVRGVLPKQNLEPIMEPILEEKLKDFGSEAEKYKKKSEDMKHLTEIDTRYINGEQLTTEDLKFLYEIDSKIESFGYGKDPRIDNILEDRSPKEDLAQIFNVSPEEISTTQKEAIKFVDFDENKILYHFGDIYLKDSIIDGYIFPKSVGGDLNLANLRSGGDFTLPESVGGDLNLHFLQSAEGLILPKRVGGDVRLDFLTQAKGLTLPEIVGGNVYFDRITTAVGVTFPGSVGGDIRLHNLTKAKELTLPESVGGDVDLQSITSEKDIKLPRRIGGDLNLSKLKSAKGLTLPETVNGEVILSGLTANERHQLRVKYPYLNIV